MVPAKLKYSQDHEWVKMENNNYVIGITDFAQHELGDVVFVELPNVGDTVKGGTSFASIESVKAVSDCIAPMDGKVVRINEKLLDNPELINQDAFGDGWMIEIESKDPSVYNDLMDAEHYEAFLKEGGH
jgi:glycine cleavage system H protein